LDPSSSGVSPSKVDSSLKVGSVDGVVAQLGQSTHTTPPQDGILLVVLWDMSRLLSLPERAF